MRGLFVGVIGAGRSGIAAATFLRRLGAQVLLSDRSRIQSALPTGIEVESGKHSDRLLRAGLIIRSPGVPGHLSILQKIKQRGIPVWSELELASRYAKSKQLIAITGTNGKTTTTTLVGELFKAARCPTFVVGNIGTPLSEVAFKTTAQSVLVVEVSSYQLEDIEKFHPTISCILNITPDHLEHHGTMKAYTYAKARVFENQTEKDICVLNWDDPACRRLSRRCKAKIFWFSRKKALKNGIFLSGKNVILRWNKQKAGWRLKSNLPGPHNIENILASVAIAVAGGVSLSTVRRVLSEFKGVEHRLEWVRTLRGARYINDSKATNVDSTRVALSSFSDPLIVIMGGEGKGSPYRPLGALLEKRAKSILLIGEDAPRIEKELKGAAPMERRQTMAKAVARAAVIAQPGDVVLLSPACASFDQYHNYEERGRDFKARVHALV